MPPLQLTFELKIFENRLILVKLRRTQKVCQFFGPPCRLSFSTKFVENDNLQGGPKMNKSISDPILHRFCKKCQHTTPPFKLFPLVLCILCAFSHCFLFRRLSEVNRKRHLLFNGTLRSVSVHRQFHHFAKADRHR